MSRAKAERRATLRRGDLVLDREFGLREVTKVLPSSERRASVLVHDDLPGYTVIHQPAGGWVVFVGTFSQAISRGPAELAALLRVQ